MTGSVKNVATTTSHGERIAIAVKHPRQAAVVEGNAETTVEAEIVVVEDSSNVTTVAEIAEVATVGEAREEATTAGHLAENIAAAMIADPHDVIPENQVDGGPKARAAPAGAEI